MSQKIPTRDETRHYLKEGFGTSVGHEPLLKRIMDIGFEKQIDLIELYDKMLSWCADHPGRKPSVLRLLNWVKRSNTNKTSDDDERIKTKERLQRYGN